MTHHTEPERELVRRILPWGPPAIVLALLVGAVANGWHVGLSAATGLAVVLVNFAVNGLSLARAAKVSLTAYSAVAMGGFVLRLAAIVAVMVGLGHLGWFSKPAFAFAVVAGTILLLAFELRLFAKGVGRDLVLANERTA